MSIETLMAGVDAYTSLPEVASAFDVVEPEASWRVSILVSVILVTVAFEC